MRGVLLPAALLVAGCASNIAALPPARWRADGLVLVQYVDTRRVHEACTATFGPNPDGASYMACGGSLGGKPFAIRPNPCEAAYRKDDTAVLACHEDVGHGINGWRHE